MPTKLPRHTVTETPRVREALDALRQRGEDVVMADLVVLGATTRLAELEQGSDPRGQAELRARLAARLRSGDGLDLEASLEARERGWTRT